MFRLLRYFSFTSAVALLATAAALMAFFHAHQKAENAERTQAEAIQMAGSFSRTFLPDFALFLRDTRGVPPDALRRRGELNALDIVFRHLASGLSLARVRLYAPDGEMIYSTDRLEIGGRGGHAATLATALAGRPGSTEVFHRTVAGPGTAARTLSLIGTCVPLMAEGRLVGVFEVESDVSQPLANIKRTTLHLLAAIGVTFSGLYLLLFVIVRRADAILRRQHDDLEASRGDLRLSETKFRSVTESASDAIVSIDSEGRVVSWNRGAERLFGYAAAEMVGQAVTPIVPPGHREAHCAALRRLHESLGGGDSIGRTVEREALRKDGAVIPVEMTLSRWDMEGLPHFTAILRDVSLRRLADDMVRKLSRVVEQSPVSVVITDLQGVIEYANPKFLEVAGYGAEELLGRTPALLKSGLTPPDVYHDLWRTIRSGDTWHGILRNRRKDGELFWEEEAIAPIKDAGGRITHFVGLKTDITERHRKELELQEALDRLTETNAELERFAYVASHDLQEPLRSLTSFAQLLDRRFSEALGAEGREYVGFIARAAKRMHALINDLLAYSRVTGAGHAVVPVPAVRPCRAAIDNLRTAMAESGAQVEIDDLPSVMADEVQLVQVFQNLIGNAIKFQRPGVPPRIAVRAVSEGDYCQISVSDNGIGLEHSHQDIFEIFRRLHTADAYPGTGIGLAVCKRIVRRHGGRIWASSGEEGGSTFHFTLPAA